MGRNQSRSPDWRAVASDPKAHLWEGGVFYDCRLAGIQARDLELGIPGIFGLALKEEPPANLVLEWGDRTRLGMDILAGDWEAAVARAPDWLGPARARLQAAKSRSEAKHILEQAYPRVLFLGSAALQNLERVGYVCLEHWMLDRFGCWGFPVCDARHAGAVVNNIEVRLDWSAIGFPERFLSYAASACASVPVLMAGYQVHGKRAFLCRSLHGKTEFEELSKDDGEFWDRLFEIRPPMRDLEARAEDLF